MRRRERGAERRLLWRRRVLDGRRRSKWRRRRRRAETVATTPGLHSRTGPSRARRRRDAALRSKERGPAVQRTHEAKAARRVNGRSRNTQKTALGRTSATSTQRDAFAQGTPRINLTHNFRLLDDPPRAAAAAVRRRRAEGRRRRAPSQNDEPQKQSPAHPAVPS